MPVRATGTNRYKLLTTSNWRARSLDCAYVTVTTIDVLVLAARAQNQNEATFSKLRRKRHVDREFDELKGQSNADRSASVTQVNGSVEVVTQSETRYTNRARCAS